MLRPITLKNRSLQKGPSSSTEFNALRNDIQRDITTLYNVVNKHEDEIGVNMDHVLRENYFLQNRITKLEKLLEEVKHEHEANMDDGEGKLIRSFYHASNIYSNDEKPINMDTLYGIVSPMVVTSHNKVSYRNDLGEYVLPSSVQISALETTDVEPIDEETEDRSYYDVSSDELKNAFDGNKNTFWVRKAEFNENECVTEVYGIIHIKIPEEISNNIYTNTILLHPSPEYSMSILDIQYKNNNNEWRRIETYPTEKDGNSESPVEIKETGKLVFSFPRKQINEIQIKVKQPYWFNDNNKRVFMYGFQDILVEYREYSQDSAEFVTEFSLENTNRRFSNVGNPIVREAIGSAKPDHYTVSHELYFDPGLTEQFDFAVDIFQDVQKIYVKTILKTNSDKVPVLTDIEIPYNYEEMDIEST